MLTFKKKKKKERKIGTSFISREYLTDQKRINKQTKEDTKCILCKCARKMEAHMDKLKKKNITTQKRR
jgi:hypothetical protein